MNVGVFHMLEPISASPGKDKGHRRWLEVCEFSTREFFFGIKHSFFISLSFFVYGRVRLAMEGKSVVPMSVPVSIYGYLGLLRSSIGKEMARADIATSSLWMVSTEQMAWGHG